MLWTLIVLLLVFWALGIPLSMLAGYEPYADDMRVELVEGTGHFIADVAPEAVTRSALEFFAAR